MQDNESVAGNGSADVVDDSHTAIYERALELATRRNRLDVMEHFTEGRLISSIGAAMMAEELGTSVHWLITGKRDPWQVKIAHCTDPGGRSYLGG